MKTVTVTMFSSYYISGNDSSTNTTELDKTASIIQGWISVLLIVAGLFLNILVLIALAKSSNEMFNKSVRLILSNILIRCVLIGASGLMVCSMTLICGYFNLSPSIGVCRAFCFVVLFHNSSSSLIVSKAIKTFYFNHQSVFLFNMIFTLN